MVDTVEWERANEVCPIGLNRDAFAAAWEAFQNCKIDLLADSDSETCRQLGAAIDAYMNYGFPAATQKRG